METNINLGPEISITIKTRDDLGVSVNGQPVQQPQAAGTQAGTMREKYDSVEAMLNAASVTDYHGSVYVDGVARRVADERLRVDYKSADGKGGGEVTKQAAQSPATNQTTNANSTWGKPFCGMLICIG